jgi:hypothetical protein
MAVGLIIILLQIGAGFFANSLSGSIRIYGGSNEGCAVMLLAGVVSFIALSIFASKALNRRRDQMMMKSLERMKMREKMKKGSKAD